MTKQIPGQMSLFDNIEQPEPVFDPDDFLTWCDWCAYQDKAKCCTYDEPLGRSCIRGSGFKPAKKLPKTRKKCRSCAHLRHGVAGLMEYHVYICKGFDDCISRSSDPEQAACDHYQPKGDCKTCAYRCWLHRGGKTYQGCEYYGGCGYKKREEDQNVNSDEWGWRV